MSCVNCCNCNDLNDDGYDEGFADGKSEASRKNFAKLGKVTLMEQVHGWVATDFDRFGFGDSPTEAQLDFIRQL